MRDDYTLRWVAMCCAIFLLLGPVGGRTTWVSRTTTATDAAGYNAVAVFSGVVALATLYLAGWARSRLIPLALPVLGAVAALAAFALTVVVAGVYVVARLQGGIWVYAGWTFERLGEGTTVYPAPGPPFFAFAALVGAVASLALAITWLMDPDGG